MAGRMVAAITTGDDESLLNTMKIKAATIRKAGEKKLAGWAGLSDYIMAAPLFSRP